MFIQNKDAFLLEQDPSYKKVLEDRNSGKLKGTTWVGTSAMSNRGALKLLDDLVKYRSASFEEEPQKNDDDYQM